MLAQRTPSPISTCPAASGGILLIPAHMPIRGPRPPALPGSSITQFKSGVLHFGEVRTLHPKAEGSYGCRSRLGGAPEKCVRSWVSLDLETRDSHLPSDEVLPSSLVVGSFLLRSYEREPTSPLRPRPPRPPSARALSISVPPGRTVTPVRVNGARAPPHEGQDLSDIPRCGRSKRTATTFYQRTRAIMHIYARILCM